MITIYNIHIHFIILFKDFIPKIFRDMFCFLFWDRNTSFAEFKGVTTSEEEFALLCLLLYLSD